MTTTTERPFTISGMDEALHLRYQEKSCANCRYYREHKTGAAVSECLLLGRTMGISNNTADLITWAKNRLCDEWKLRPKRWAIYSEGVDKNPHWVDPYLSRETLNRLRLRIAKRLKLYINWI